ncbi:MAG: flagellar hook-associated protein FlgL [Gammaproteobacteria bacterium]
MRIATSQITDNAVSTMQDLQSQLAKTQQQLSTGKRVLTPADDPSAAASILALNQSVSLTQQYLRNSDVAQTRLNQEDTTLSGATNILQRVHELAVQANSGTMSASDRRAIAAEVSQLSQQLQGLANTTDASGEYLFAGFKSNTQPFTDNGTGTISYNGDQGTRLLQIGPQRQVEVGDSGASVFMSIPASGGGVQSVFATLNKFVSDLNANTPSPSTITDVNAAMSNLLTVRAKVGARLNAIDSQNSVNTSYLTQTQSALSKVQDLDYASAISSFNQQTLALQAAQNSYTKIQGLSLFNYLR